MSLKSAENVANVDADEVETGSIARIRQAIEQNRRRKEALRQASDTEVRQAQTVAKRIKSLEDQLRAMLDARQRSDERSARLDKEATELRKRCGLLETKLARVGTRANAYTLRRQMKTMEHMHMAELESIETQKNEIEMTRCGESGELRDRSHV